MPAETIRKIVKWINNYDEQGGLWMPNIQRDFVWKQNQIEKMFDSIMREYPIGSLLFWKTKENVKRRKFIDSFKKDIKFTDYYEPESEKQKLLVLDGQQRLQSLYFALAGQYYGEELYFDVLSGKNEVEDIKYNFLFLTKDKAKSRSQKSPVKESWVNLKDIVYSCYDYDELAEITIDNIGRELLKPEDKKQIRSNIARIIKVCTSEPNVSYQILDSVDNPNKYSLNDIVEVFIRANTGGTTLSKSDLMFSLLTASWKDIDKELDNLMDELNKNVYKFSKDFVLKTCLILIGAGAKYDVMKFRNEENLDKLHDNWKKIKNSILIVRDFVHKNTFLRNDKALTSYIPLIPIIYLNKNYNRAWKSLDKKVISSWLLKMLLTGAFSGSSDTILDVVVKDIRENKSLNIDSINNIISNRGRNIHITEDGLFNAYYGSKQSYLLFSLWYKDTDFDPSYDNNLPTIDHIFPQSRLKKIKLKDEFGEKTKIRKYKSADINQLANLMLLSKEENVEEKQDVLPEDWFMEKSKEYFKLHLIPDNKELWKLKNFEKFIEARKKLIIQKFKDIGLL